MKIVHFSDWHTNFRRLPEADLYICTGDMYPNFPIGPQYDIHRQVEIERQTDWIKTLGYGSLRDCLANHNAPVVCVNGNHDFIDVMSLFEGEVYQIRYGESIELLGKTISGFEGVPPICGEWSNEMSERNLGMLCDALTMPLDIIVTHTPPFNIFDQFGWNGRYNCGSTAYREWLNQLDTSGYKQPIHCFFGHCHEKGGSTGIKDNQHYYNAAKTFIEVEI